MTAKKKTSSKKKKDAEEAVQEEARADAGQASAAGEPAADAAEQGDAAGAQQKEAEEMRDRYLRLQADFENFRKRTNRERGEMVRRANEDLLGELLPVLDHFEIGLKTARDHQSDEAVVEGFQLVYDQFQQTLRKFGVEPVDAEGEKFDPGVHEAMSHLPSPDHEEGQVTHQVRRGYRLADRVIRPAQVVVSSGPPEEKPEEEP
ncbi:nucleotide exchange factor GrpE [Kiritimatiella glycovorans]|uniref:Protein GrpE n=1 Tax=Kiritimatiella glycovorans TaxID=1307763 RepID=A0A0G3EMS2_9BACT|nr:nucleotide exchange factor GrpE [Kiritimatiella glycovorans]AKJ65404.1 Heat shock protein GrpE [Kiritimatiella glycovorans]